MILFVGLLILLTVAGYHWVNRPKTAEIRIGACQINVEIADTPELCAKGLSGRNHLKADHGMLFVFQYSRRLSFWMKDTSIPLSIAFISPDGTIRQIEQMMPFDLNLVKSDAPVKYALEVNQGFFKKNGITVGMRVDLSNMTGK